MELGFLSTACLCVCEMCSQSPARSAESLRRSFMRELAAQEGRSQKPDDVHFSWFVDVTQTCFVLFLRPFLPKILRRRAKNEKEEDPVPVSLLHPIDLHMYARTSYILFYSIRLHGRYLSFDGTWKEDALLTDLRGSSSSNSSPVPLLQKGLHVCLHPALQFANKLIYHQNELVASQQNKVNSF